MYQLAVGLQLGSLAQQYKGGHPSSHKKESAHFVVSKRNYITTNRVQKHAHKIYRRWNFHNHNRFSQWLISYSKVLLAE